MRLSSNFSGLAPPGDDDWALSLASRLLRIFEEFRFRKQTKGRLKLPCPLPKENQTFCKQNRRKIKDVD